MLINAIGQRLIDNKNVINAIGQRLIDNKNVAADAYD
jgi:hypothetical protein